MSARPKEEIFRAITKENPAIIPAFAEKDWFITQVINVISKINIEGFDIVFSGGTALSKAYKLINRFSEDIDFRVVTSEAGNSRTKRSAFKNAVIDNLRQAGCVIQEHQIKARDENRFFAIEIDYDTYFDRPTDLRPHIQIEVIFRSPQLSPEKHSVASFFAELSGNKPEVSKILCVQPVENAADKLSALVWRIPDRVRGSDDDDPSIVRHIHDLSLLKDTAIKSEEFVKMVLYSMECDNSRPKNYSSFQASSVEDKFQNMFDILEQDTEYHEEYERFIEMMSYAPTGQVPDFNAAMKSVKELVEIVKASS